MSTNAAANNNANLEEDPNATPDPNAVTDPAADANDPPGGDDSADPDPAQSTQSQADDDRSPRTARERALMNHARADEKKKLYNTTKNLKNEVASLKQRLEDKQAAPRSRVRAAANTEGDDPEDLRTSIRDLNARLDQQEKTVQLADYKRSVIRGLQSTGVEFVEALISGDSEEAIDVSAAIAQEEAAYLHVQFMKKHGMDPNSTEITRTTRTRTGVQRHPPGVPHVPPRPGSGETENDDSYSLEKVSNILRRDHAGVRGGAYAQHRDKILAALQRGELK